MIAHFPLENEDLAGALPVSSSRGRWLSSSARPPIARLAWVVVIARTPCSPLAEEALFSSVAQQEVKVEVKDHLRAGDFERASCYTQSRQDSEPECQANNARVHRPW